MTTTKTGPRQRNVLRLASRNRIIYTQHTGAYGQTVYAGRFGGLDVTSTARSLADRGLLEWPPMERRMGFGFQQVLRPTPEGMQALVDWDQKNGAQRRDLEIAEFERVAGSQLLTDEEVAARRERIKADAAALTASVVEMGRRSTREALAVERAAETPRVFADTPIRLADTDLMIKVEDGALVVWSPAGHSLSVRGVRGSEFKIEALP